MKTKFLCILHRSPPAHGAAKVGDFISSNIKLNEEFDCRFITIKSSDTIGDIGKVNFKKLYLVIELYIKILITLFFFRPNKIYFTASVKGVAFFRDVLVSTLWKVYGLFVSVEVFYHYHTKGIDNFISSSFYKLWLTNFFLKNVNIILLSPLLEKDLKRLTAYKKILFLPNGVENNYTEDEFESYILDKKFNNVNILYLSNMIKSKGYFEVLKLANKTKDKNYHYHFAGGWQNEKEEKDFFEFVEDNGLKNTITYHGFVNGNQKKELFENSQLFIFPTRYENEAFPLSILEAFSYGIPVVSTDEGSIPFIIDKESGVVIENLNDLPYAFDKAMTNFINIDTAKYCRQRYLNNFSLEKFEKNMMKIMNGR